MEPNGPEHKDLSDPTFNFTDLVTQTVGGSLRWLATVLAVAALGLSVWFLFDKEKPEIFFPFHLQGDAVYWVTGFAFLIWLLLAVVNWRNWLNKKRLEKSFSKPDANP